MSQPQISVRIFFETPKVTDAEAFITQAIAAIPDATDLDLSLSYRTARFRSRVRDSQSIRKSLQASGLAVVSVHCSPPGR